MPREPYLKPEIKSEVLEPGTLGARGSGFGDPAGPLTTGTGTPNCCCFEDNSD